MGLKPCPFCGQPAKLVWQSELSEAVACDNDECVIGPDDETGPYCWSAEAWNRRPVEDALAARVAELEKENERLAALAVEPEEHCDEDGYAHCACIVDVHRKSDALPTVQECYYHQQIRADRDALAARVAELEAERDAKLAEARAVSAAIRKSSRRARAILVTEVCQSLRAAVKAANMENADAMYEATDRIRVALLDLAGNLGLHPDDLSANKADPFDGLRTSAYTR